MPTVFEALWYTHTLTLCNNVGCTDWRVIMNRRARNARVILAALRCQSCVYTYTHRRRRRRNDCVKFLGVRIEIRFVSPASGITCEAAVGPEICGSSSRYGRFCFFNSTFFPYWCNESFTCRGQLPLGARCVCVCVRVPVD